MVKRVHICPEKNTLVSELSNGTNRYVCRAAVNFVQMTLAWLIWTAANILQDVSDPVTHLSYSDNEG